MVIVFIDIHLLSFVCLKKNLISTFIKKKDCIQKMWPAQLKSVMLYRGSSVSKYKHYDYSRKRAQHIPHLIVENHVETCNLTSHTLGDGLYHELSHTNIANYKNKHKIGVGVNTNHGIPFGNIGLNPPKNKKELESKEYQLPEEQITQAWMLTLKGMNSIATCLNSMKKESGNWAYGMFEMKNEKSILTRQGINYRDLHQSKDKHEKFPIERLYANSYVIENANLPDVLDSNPNPQLIPVTFAFVAGPQTSDASLYLYDIAKRTLDLEAYSNFESFKTKIKWAYYALLHSLACENCKIALIPWISKLTTPHRIKYREDDVKNIVNQVLNMDAYQKDAATGVSKVVKLKQFFTKVVIYTAQKDTDLYVELETKMKSEDNSFIVCSYNILCNDPSYLEDNYPRWTKKRKKWALDVLKATDLTAIIEPSPLQYDYLANEMKSTHEFVYRVKDKGGAGNMGTAIAWNKSIFTKDSDLAQNIGIGFQQIVAAKLTHKNTKKSIIVVALHLKAGNSSENEKTRDKQLKAIEHIINKKWSDKNLPVILLGDFNSNRYNSSNYIYKNLLHQGYTDPFASLPEHETYTMSQGGKHTLDYILFKSKKKLEAKNARVLSDIPNIRNTSDHLPIVCTMNFT